MTAFPKTDYVRSKTLLEAYRKIPCQHCGADDGTVCGAHSNWSEHGKGRSIKASDIYCASLCAICHYQLDHGFLWDRETRKQVWLDAHRKTIRELVKLGYWPKGVEAPKL